jgi:hypothetical protein
MTLSWIDIVALFCFSSLCIWFLMFYFFLYLFHFHSFFYPHDLAFRCSKRFCHCMPVHSMPYCGVGVGHQHLQVHPPPHAWAWVKTHFLVGCPKMRVGFCSSSSEDGKMQFWFVVCVTLFLASNKFFCISIFPDWGFLHVLIFSLHFVCS